MEIRQVCLENLEIFPFHISSPALLSLKSTEMVWLRKTHSVFLIHFPIFLPGELRINRTRHGTDQGQQKRFEHGAKGFKSISVQHIHILHIPLLLLPGERNETNEGVEGASNK